MAPPGLTEAEELELLELEALEAEQQQAPEQAPSSGDGFFDALGSPARWAEGFLAKPLEDLYSVGSSIYNNPGKALAGAGAGAAIGAGFGGAGILPGAIMGAMMGPSADDILRDPIPTMAAMVPVAGVPIEAAYDAARGTLKDGAYYGGRVVDDIASPLGFVAGVKGARAAKAKAKVNSAQFRQKYFPTAAENRAAAASNPLAVARILGETRSAGTPGKGNLPPLQATRLAEGSPIILKIDPTRANPELGMPHTIDTNVNSPNWQAGRSAQQLEENLQGFVDNQSQRKKTLLDNLAAQERDSIESGGPQPFTKDSDYGPIDDFSEADIAPLTDVAYNRNGRIKTTQELADFVGGLTGQLQELFRGKPTLVDLEAKLSQIDAELSTAQAYDLKANPLKDGEIKALRGMREVISNALEKRVREVGGDGALSQYRELNQNISAGITYKEYGKIAAQNATLPLSSSPGSVASNSRVPNMLSPAAGSDNIFDMMGRGVRGLLGNTQNRRNRTQMQAPDRMIDQIRQLIDTHNAKLPPQVSRDFKKVRNDGKQLYLMGVILHSQGVIANAADFLNLSESEQAKLHEAMAMSGQPFMEAPQSGYLSEANGKIHSPQDKDDLIAKSLESGNIEQIGGVLEGGKLVGGQAQRQPQPVFGINQQSPLAPQLQDYSSAFDMEPDINGIYGISPDSTAGMMQQFMQDDLF